MTIKYVNNLFIHKKLPIEIRFHILSKIYNPISFFEYNLDINIVYGHTLGIYILNSWGLKYPDNFPLSPKEIVLKIINLCDSLEIPYYSSTFLLKSNTLGIIKYITPKNIKHYPYNVLLKIVDLNDTTLLKFMIYNNLINNQIEQYLKDTLLAEACYKNKLNMVIYLLSINANVNSCDSKPLYYSLSCKNIDIVKYLLQNYKIVVPHYFKGNLITNFITHCKKNNREDTVHLLTDF